MITFSRLGYYGQLGNQMWQYAFLLGAAARHGNDYKVCIPRRLDLPKKAGRFELNCFRGLSAGPLWGNENLPHKYTEQSTGFDLAALEQPDGTDFAGYFQSWRYFAHCAEQVKEEFRFHTEIYARAKALMSGYEVGRPAVSVNVRRGDYLQHRGTHFVCDINYYREAMAGFSGARFYVGSDDINWCRKHLAGIPSVTFIDTTDYVAAFAVIVLCDAHIGSASSFSWWGAWLSGGRAIFPDSWYVPGALEYSIEDLRYPGAEMRPAARYLG
jgi:hypothetical protein